MKMKYLIIFTLIVCLVKLNKCFEAQECAEPSEHKLEKILEKKIKENAKFTNEIAFNHHLWEKFANIVKKLEYPDEHMQEECKEKENSPIDYGNFQIFPVCPHILKNLTTNREARYPKRVEYAKCLCTEKCSFQKLFNNHHSRCQPVIYAKPGRKALNSIL